MNLSLATFFLVNNSVIELFLVVFVISNARIWFLLSNCVLRYIDNVLTEPWECKEKVDKWNSSMVLRIFCVVRLDIWFVVRSKRACVLWTYKHKFIIACNRFSAGKFRTWRAPTISYTYNRCVIESKWIMQLRSTNIYWSLTYVLAEIRRSLIGNYLFRGLSVTSDNPQSKDKHIFIRSVRLRTISDILVCATLLWRHSFSFISIVFYSIPFYCILHVPLMFTTHQECGGNIKAARPFVQCK